MSTKNLKYSKPSLLRCIAAIAYDAILLIALLILLSFPWVILAKGLGMDSKWGLRIIAISLVIGFYTYFWQKKQQTLGMTTWRIKLVNANSLRPSSTECTLRILGAFLSAACLGLGYLWMLIDKDKMSWHDRLSKTELILVAKKKK